ncbi:MAG: hypothetical protein R3C53_18660 [Pirellulaceae bacterium]
MTTKIPNQQNYGNLNTSNPNNIAYGPAPNTYDNPYRNSNPPGSGFANPATSGPTLQDRGERLASLPGSSSQSTAGSSPSDNSGGTPNAETQTQPRSKAGENFLQVFFLLSLVVNFYLGVLIRKLLMRYRSLLASVRSQTA